MRPRMVKVRGESKIGQRRRAAQKEPSGDYVARRTALLKAAADCFREKGYEAARIDDVAEAAGIDRATLYYYFPNKQQLFRTLITEALEERVAAASAIADGEGSAPEKLRALIVDLWESYQEHYPLMYVYVQEDMRRLATDDSPQAAVLMSLGERYSQAVRRVIAQGIDDGYFGEQFGVTLTAHAVIGAVSWSHRWYSPVGELSAREIGEQFADLFLQGVLTPTARRRRTVSRGTRGK
jgi:TetR/AcrR family transcriptional regulator, cholesterol catabolism regulator